MNPLSALYGVVLRRRNKLYDNGKFQVRRLQGPVISIGNIAAGGSGKTPFLITLGKLLKQHGVAFDVLSRGYGRSTKGVALVDAAGSPRDFGDEPLLITRKLRVPVIVGEDRFLAGEFAEQKFGPQLHLLDDGFQHRRLARDFNIVLITSTDATDSLLPAGRLREPLAALSRADAIVLTNQTSPDGLPLTDQRVWRVWRDIVAPEVRERCVAFCGIARPGSFFAQLRAAGIPLAVTQSFSDHHTYTHADIRQLRTLRQKFGAMAFLTTEKDAINLGAGIDALAPVHVVPVRMEIDDAETVVDALLEAIAKQNSLPA